MWSNGDHGEIGICYTAVGRAGSAAVDKMKDSFEAMCELEEESRKEVQS